MLKVIAIVQARMGSTRLPGKVAKKVKDKPMLTHLLERLKYTEELDQIIVATSKKEQDDRVAEIAEESGISCFRGSEHDVLLRYIAAARENNADVIVRITGDCPLIDPDTIDEIIKDFISSEVEYMGHSGYPRGLDTEVFYLKSLFKAEEMISREEEQEDNSYREHVTLYIYRHPEDFKIDFYEAPDELRRDYRLCVDEQADFNLIIEIYKRLYKPGEIIDICDVIELLDNNPELAEMNSNVQQKKV